MSVTGRLSEFTDNSQSHCTHGNRTGILTERAGSNEKRLSKFGTRTIVPVKFPALSSVRKVFTINVRRDVFRGGLGREVHCSSPKSRVKQP